MEVGSAPPRDEETHRGSHKFEDLTQATWLTTKGKIWASNPAAPWAGPRKLTASPAVAAGPRNLRASSSQAPNCRELRLWRWELATFALTDPSGDSSALHHAASRNSPSIKSPHHPRTSS